MSRDHGMSHRPSTPLAGTAFIRRPESESNDRLTLAIWDQMTPTIRSRARLDELRQVGLGHRTGLPG
jgi:hypothetical protein